MAVVRWPLFFGFVRWRLFFGLCSLFVVRCSLFVVRCSLLVALSGVRGSQLVVVSSVIRSPFSICLRFMRFGSMVRDMIVARDSRFAIRRLRLALVSRFGSRTTYRAERPSPSATAPDR
jgi:hypothetical protein